MKRHSLFFQTALDWASLLVDRLVFYALRPTHVAHASGGPCDDSECWDINANGFTGLLVFTSRTPPTTSNGNSTRDAYYGEVFFEDQSGELILGYKVSQADGSVRVSFVRLGERSSGFADYFQVYTGIQSADGQSMSGTFQVYTGGIIFSQIEHRRFYGYTRDQQIYSWTATRSTSHLINVINRDLPTWSLNANEFEGILQMYITYAVGLAFGDGMIGKVLAHPDCSDGCGMYFVRATSTDFSTMQVYQGTCTTSPSGTTAVGTFVEIAQGHSGTNYQWSATYQGHHH